MQGKAELLVIGAGVGRTGTSSLKRALEILGLPTYHGNVMFEKGASEMSKWDQLQGKKLRRIARGDYRGRIDVDRKQWDDIFTGYLATLDYPACQFYLELKEVFPRAKVILTVRSPDAWYQSIQTTIAAPQFEPLLMTAISICGLFESKWRAAKKTALTQLWLSWSLAERGYDLSAMHSEEIMCSLFNEHNLRVQESVSEDELLVFDVKEGWGPLCRFLGVPEPVVAFPKLNDQKGFRSIWQSVYWRAAIYVLALLELPIFVAALLRAGLDF